MLKKERDYYTPISIKVAPVNRDQGWMIHVS